MACCKCCPESFRKEIALRKCGLRCVRASCFYCSQFQIPEIIFIIIKAIFAVYTLVWLIINIVEAPGSGVDNGHSPFVFLTTWSYILLNLYLYVSLADALYMTYKHVRDGDLRSLKDVLGHRRRRYKENELNAAEHEGPEEHDYKMTWYHKVEWVLHDMITGAAPMVTLIYFAFLYPMVLEENPGFAASALDINIHGINTLIMLIDNFLNAIPIRIMHVIYPAIYGLIYVVFSLIFFAFDTEHNILYPKLLDWTSPETTIPTIIAVVFVLMPLLQLAWYCWYRLRLWVFHKIYHYVYDDPTKL